MPNMGQDPAIDNRIATIRDRTQPSQWKTGKCDNAGNSYSLEFRPSLFAPFLAPLEFKMPREIPRHSIFVSSHVRFSPILVQSILERDRALSRRTRGPNRSKTDACRVCSSWADQFIVRRLFSNSDESMSIKRGGGIRLAEISTAQL